VTTQVDRLKVGRLKEKTPACAAGAAGRCAITQTKDRLDTPACAVHADRLAGDCVMDDHYCSSVFSLQPKHLSSYGKIIENELIRQGISGQELSI
jgi:hypothetical protein